MKIVLRKMGMDFMGYYNESSDVGNHRVRAEFTDKNGIVVVVDFGGYERKESYGFISTTSEICAMLICSNVKLVRFSYV